MTTVVRIDDLRSAIRELGLAERCVCVHSSLRSFGRVEGGAATIVDAFIGEGCTLLVPAFSFDAYALDPPPHMRPKRNGWDYTRTWFGRSSAPVYEPASERIDERMGAVSSEVVRRPGRVRGVHPLCSFAAIGPQAQALVGRQTTEDVFAPLAALARRGGAVVLMGVGLNRMTLLHLAERRAGRRIFVRWAAGDDGPVAVRVGGCSEGFENLHKHLWQIQRTATVGRSAWRVFDARSALNVATHAIRRNPRVTHCADDACIRCRDAIAGGPEA